MNRYVILINALGEDRMNKKNKKTISSLVSGVIVIAFMLYSGLFGNNQEAKPNDENLYDVVRVVDGDTLIVDIDGKDTKVRMIGINTPESVHNDPKKNTYEGVVASKYVKELLENQQVYIEYDEERLDQYDRTLAYVYTKDKELVNLKLIELGYATCMFYEPNTKYKDMFYEAMDEAKQNDVGFWRTDFFH